MNPVWRSEDTRQQSRWSNITSLALALLLVLAACNGEAADVSESRNELVLGRWELADDRSREWLDFGEDGTWEAWGDWESPTGESIVGTYVQYGDSVSGTSIYGLEMTMRVRGDTLVLSDGTRYVRAGR